MWGIFRTGLLLAHYLATGGDTRSARLRSLDGREGTCRRQRIDQEASLGSGDLGLSDPT